MKNYVILVLALLAAGGCAGQPREAAPVQPEAPESRGSAPTESENPAATGKSAANAAEAQAPEVHTDLSASMLYRLLLAEIAGQRGQVDTAVAAYVEAARESRDPDVAERATRIAVYSRNDELAMEAARIWVSLVPDSLEAHQVAAAMSVRAGDTGAAQRHLERVIALSDNGGHGGFMLVTSLLSKEADKQTALAAMGKLVADRQDNPDALYAYSQLALLVGEYHKALDSAAKLRELRPNWAEAHILYSNILIRQEKPAQAIDNLQQAVDANPDDTQLRNYYARVLVDEKRYKAAAQQFRELLKDAPDHTQAIYALGLLSMQLSELEQARKYFLRLNELGERTNEAGYYLGQIAETRGEREQAIEWYEQVRDGQYHIDSQLRTAALEARAGDIDEARQRLHAINPESDEQRLQIVLTEGEILRQAKRYEQALEVYNNALQQMPNNIQILYARSLVAERLDRVEMALQDMRYIVSREPENAQALNALGYTLVDRTDKVEEGMQYIQRAYQLRPDDAAILDSMGWAHYRLGNHDEALKYLRKAYNKVNDGEIAAHLGEVLWVTGDHEAAREVWNEALTQSPSHELLLDVIKRFTE